MSTNWVLLGRMKAEFEAGCKEIRERAAFVEKDSMQAAFQALLDGDTYGRDLSCDKAQAVPEITDNAIEELWYRIGEKYGLPRERAKQMRAAMLQKEKPAP